MKWLIVSYLVINPLFFLAGVHTRDVQQVCFQITSVIIFSCGMFLPNRAIKKSLLNVFLGVLILTFLVAWLRSMSGWTNALNLILGIMVYITIVRTMSKDDTRLIFKTVAWLSILAITWLMFQFLGWDMANITIKNTAGKLAQSAFFRHNSSMGLYFAQTLPLTMGFTPLGLLFLIPLKFSECAGAWLGAIGGMFFFLWFRKRIFFWVLLIPIIAGVAFHTINKENYQSFNIRIPAWKRIIPDIWKNPLGHGLDSFANPSKLGQWKYYQNIKTYEIIKIIKLDNNKWKPEKKMTLKDFESVMYLDHPHNEYIWLAYDIGVQGLIVLGFIMYFIWKRFWNSRKDAQTVALMAFMISVGLCCLTQFSFHLARVGHMVPVVLGLFYLNTEEEEL
ncbi:MAG TPA: hypothetical protein ENH82_07305 [bacterium]|nr:hypothetical protein [bacterium]